MKKIMYSDEDLEKYDEDIDIEESEKEDGEIDDG